MYHNAPLSCCLTKAARHEYPTQEMHLSHLVQVSTRACIPVSHRTVTIEGTVLSRLPPPENHTDSQLNHTLSPPVKRLINLPWTYSLRSGLHVCQTSRGYKGALREHKPANAILALSFGLTTMHQYLPERSLYIFVDPRFLQLLQLLEVRRVYNWGPTFFAKFKNICSRVLASN